MRRYGGPLIGLRYRMRRLLLRLRTDRDNVLESVYGMSKRGIDVLLTSLVLFGIWPFLMITAFLIWVSDPGPVFYYQTRVGRDGRTFRFPKFRSMVMNAERLKDKLASQGPAGNDVRFKMKRDPRIIPIGYVLRRYSIDELPQLWSVLRGDLSLVGPRPPLPREVELYTMADRRRLEVVPGLTCIWQVTGRSDIPFEEQVKLDTDYIDGRGLALDLKLLIATLGAVVTARGAY